MSTRNAVINFLRLPRGESSSPVAANRMTKSEWSAWLMKCLVPLMTKSPPVPHGARLHAAQVRTRTRLGHRQAFGSLAAYRGQEILFALRAFAGEQDVRWPCDADELQGIARAPELFFVKHAGHRIESRAAEVRGHIGRIQPGIHGLGLERPHKVRGQLARRLHQSFVRIELLLYEFASRLDDELLFIV